MSTISSHNIGAPIPRPLTSLKIHGSKPTDKGSNRITPTPTASSTIPIPTTPIPRISNSFPRPKHKFTRVTTQQGPYRTTDKTAPIAVPPTSSTISSRRSSKGDVTANSATASSSLSIPAKSIAVNQPSSFTQPAKPAPSPKTHLASMTAGKNSSVTTIKVAAASKPVPAPMNPAAISNEQVQRSAVLNPFINSVEGEELFQIHAANLQQLKADVLSNAEVIKGLGLESHLKVKIDLSASSSSDSDFREYDKIFQLPNLSSINFAGNSLDNTIGILFIAAINGKFRKLESLKIDGNIITRQTAEIFFNALSGKRLPLLKELIFAECKIKQPDFLDKLLIHIATGSLPSIMHVDASRNKLRINKIPAITNPAVGVPLSQLNLSGNAIDDDGKAEFAKVRGVFTSLLDENIDLSNPVLPVKAPKTITNPTAIKKPQATGIKRLICCF